MKNKPVCYIPGKVFPEIYSGIPTFLGLPKLSAPQDLPGNDIIFMGIPFEGICTYGTFSGCELATKSIRNASTRYSGFLPEMNVDVFDYLTGGDYGDVAVHNGNIAETFAFIEKKFGEILDSGAFPVCFGGDHSTCYPLIKTFAKKYDGNIGVIHFDGHMDNLDTYGDEEKYARCSPLHRIYEIDGINPKNIVHMGIRGPRNVPVGPATAREKGATIISSFEIKFNGVVESIRKAIKIAQAGTKAVYVTVCADILDVAHNPGGPPDPCGLSSWEFAVILYELGKAGIKGFDYVEIYPPTDRNNVSSHVEVWMILYLLAGLVEGRFNLNNRLVENNFVLSK